MNVYINRDCAYTTDGKNALDDVTIDDLLEESENEKKQKNDAYRKIYPWQMISGRLLRYTTGDESCYTPVIEKCNMKEKERSEEFEFHSREIRSKEDFLDRSIQLDLLIVVERSTTLTEIRRQLEEQLAKQLDLLETNQMNVSLEKCS